MGQNIKKISILIILTQWSLYNYGSLNKEQKLVFLKEKTTEKNISSGNTIIATFSIPEGGTKNILLFGEDTPISHVKKRIEKIIITEEKSKNTIELNIEEKKDNKHNFNTAGTYVVYYHLKEQEDLSHMFDSCEKLIGLDLSNLDYSNVIYINHLCCNCKNLKRIIFNDKKENKTIKDMSYMFYNCENLTSLNLSCFYTSNCQDMSYMFYRCKSLEILNIFNLDTTNCETMSYMFYNCESLTSLDLSKFYTTECIDASYMFFYCRSLANLNISNFEPSQITNKEKILEGCSSLTEITIKNKIEKMVLQQQNNLTTDFKFKKQNMCSVI